MSVQQKRVLIGSTGSLAIVALTFVFAGVLAGSGRTDSARTIVLTTKGMAFNGTNPDILVAPGETVRLLLRNDDPGMKHDVAIPGLELESRAVSYGSAAVLVFTAPARAGATLEYLCTFHPKLMRGRIVVRRP